MINYTDCLTLLMQDVVTRVKTLSFIDVSDLLVFGRFGRSNAEGAFATCHCLSLPPSEPGYYFWRDRVSGQITRRSEWFVTRSPAVTIGSRPIKYLISFTLPRFCDQSLVHSRKERFYRRASDGWMAKLDTVIHELYHIDPQQNGIRRLENSDGKYSAHCHSPQFFAQVAGMVSEYLDSRPDPAIYDFLRHDFDTLQAKYERVVGTSFRTFPSYPQRFIERLAVQPRCESDGAAAAPPVIVEPLPPSSQRAVYTCADLHIRTFTRDASRRVACDPPASAARSSRLVTLPFATATGPPSRAALSAPRPAARRTAVPLAAARQAGPPLAIAAPERKLRRPALAE